MKKSQRNVRFAILWSNRPRSAQKQSAQVSTYIEDRRRNFFYHSTAIIVTGHIIGELTEKKIIYIT